MRSGGERLYGGPDVCRAAGVSYRKLDYWDRTGVVCPTRAAHGSGTWRGYTADEAIAVALVEKIASLGKALPSGALGAVLSGGALAVVVAAQGCRPRLQGVKDLDELRDLFKTHPALTVIDMAGIRDQVTDRLATMAPSEDHPSYWSMA